MDPQLLFHIFTAGEPADVLQESQQYNNTGWNCTFHQPDNYFWGKDPEATLISSVRNMSLIDLLMLYINYNPQSGLHLIVWFKLLLRYHTSVNPRFVIDFQFAA